jgi:hypothetical protein
MQQTDFEKLLAETLAAQGRSPRTQETYTRESAPPSPWTERRSANAPVRLGPPTRAQNGRRRRPPRPSGRRPMRIPGARGHCQRPGAGPHGQSKVLRRNPRPWFNSAYPQPLATYSVAWSSLARGCG